MSMFVAGDSVVHIQDNAVELAKSVGSDGDILVRGWLTTEKKNAFNQIVHASTFDHDEGTHRWNGRMMLAHGRRWLIGGGNEVPVGQFTKHSIIEGSGFYGIGHVYKENDALLKRAVLDGTLNGWSIGFIILADGKKPGARLDKKTDITHITKGSLHETSLCTIGANDESIVEVVHSLQARGYGSTDPNEELINRYDNRGYFYLVFGGKRYLVNPQGDITDGD